ncbi:MAG: hypothetical protein PWR21_2234 [Methanoculleus sp.]|nr:hypothetical protein [Methanoculleus sp.]MDK2990527.1 hypothetical protein [Methanoculleus sp.]
MRTHNILLACALMCCIGIILVSGASAISQGEKNVESQIVNQNNILDCEEAKNQIQAFMEGKDISIEYKGTMPTPSGDMMLFGSDDERYYINSQSGSIEGALFLRSLDNSNEVRFNAENAQKIAEDYAKSKYRPFTQKNMQLIRSDLLDHGDGGKEYLFVWCEIVNGALTPNYVSISINPNTGEVISYIGIERALNVDLDPEISREDAIKTAIAQFKEIKVSNVDTQLAVIYVDQNEQCLAWVVTIDGKESDSTTQGGTVLVDAMSGKVVQVDPYL